MKHSKNAKKAYSDLQTALDRMLKVLKNLNDPLHVVGLKGFPVSYILYYTLYMQCGIHTATTVVIESSSLLAHTPQ